MYTYGACVLEFCINIATISQYVLYICGCCSVLVVIVVVIVVIVVVVVDDDDDDVFCAEKLFTIFPMFSMALSAFLSICGRYQTRYA